MLAWTGDSLLWAAFLIHNFNWAWYLAPAPPFQQNHPVTDHNPNQLSCFSYSINTTDLRLQKFTFEGLCVLWRAKITPIFGSTDILSKEKSRCSPRAWGLGPPMCSRGWLYLFSSRFLKSTLRDFLISTTHFVFLLHFCPFFQSIHRLFE